MDAYCKNCDCFYVISDRSGSDDVIGNHEEWWLCPVCWDVLSSDMTDSKPLET